MSFFSESKIGEPLHGLKAGLSAFKVFSPTAMLYDSYRGFKDDGVKGFLKAGPHNIQDAFKDNWPALLAAVGGAAANGAGAAGSSAAGGGYTLGIDAAGGLTSAGAPGAVSTGSTVGYAGGAGGGAAGGASQWQRLLSNALQNQGGQQQPTYQSNRERVPLATDPQYLGSTVNSQDEMRRRMLIEELLRNA